MNSVTAKQDNMDRNTYLVYGPRMIDIWLSASLVRLCRLFDSYEHGRRPGHVLIILVY